MSGSSWVRSGAISGLLAVTACVSVSDRETLETPAEGPAISPVLQKPPGRFLKRKVAIARFTNETNYGKSVFLDQHGDTIGKQASDILATRLTASEKFLLLERRDMGKIEEEAKRGDLKPELIGADYLILGSVTEFGRSTTSETGVFSRTKKQRAYAKVSLRLVDVRTGLTIYSEEGRGEAFVEVGKTIGIGTGAGYDSTLNEKAISAAISKVVSNLAENLLERPWQSYVLSADDGKIVIGGGASQGVAPGDRFAVLRRGKRLKNPQTGSSIEMPGTRIATIEVATTFGSTVQDEGAICKLVTGTVDPAEISELLVQESKE